MSGPFGSSQFMYATGAAEEGQSLRFEDGDSPYFSFTFGTPTNQIKWTMSFWCKRGEIGREHAIYGATNGGGETFFVAFYPDDIEAYISSGRNHVTNAVFRDPSAWYHIVQVFDSANATADDRFITYVNGARQTTSTNSVVQNDTTGWNTSGVTGYFGKNYGAWFGDSRDHFDGYLANVTFIDGQALTPTSFGEYQDTLWKPKSDADITSLTFGTNGFYLPFKQTTEAEGFSTVTYVGTGNQPHSIEGVGFEPDFVWVKKRNGSENHELVDSVRGATKRLQSNVTTAENTGGFTSFDSNGFTLSGGYGTDNESGYNYVAWCWDAGSGSAASNTDGTITSTVKANTAKGFSIATYTGNGSSGATFGHGLGVAPDMVIVKRRDGSNSWQVYTSVLGATKFLELHSSGAEQTATNRWNDTAPSSSVVTLGNNSNVNSNGGTCVAYSFASVSGYSSIGSYSGTGASGNSITGLGFKPAWIMIKRTDSADNWVIFDNTRDPVNSAEKYLLADSSQAEATFSTVKVDFDSDGFTLQGSANSINNSSGTYIYMAFADTRDATFFGDTSGNGNNWTPNAINNTDVVPDSPVTGGNFTTLNPLTLSQGTLYEGNLRISSTAANRGFAVGTQKLHGKVYFEVRHNGGQGGFVGIGDTSNSNHQSIDFYDGTPRIDGVAGSALGAFSTGDICGVAVNIDTKSIQFFKNGSSILSTTYTTDVEYFPYIYDSSGGRTMDMIANFGQDSSFAGNETPQGNTDDNGVGDFYYAPPSGYLALTTGNLPTPTITAPDDYFNTVLYTGTGATQSITGVGFQPDFIWAKGRSVGYSHGLYDVVRGAPLKLSSNLTNAEVSQGITAFDSDGFTLDSDAGLNQGSATYVAWNWLAGGTAVSNTDGSITSQVGANTDAGFSIVGYTGNGTAGATIGHGLSSTLELVLLKDRSGTDSWRVYSSATGGTKSLYLNLTNAAATDSTIWNNTAPTSSVFTIGNDSGVNTNTNNYIAYCFHSVEGYSKIGSYTGNGSADGTFVHCGFRPAFVMLKRSNSAEDWYIADSTRDTENDAGRALFPNTSGAEASYSSALDLLSNGFKLRNSGGLRNGSGDTYIFLAFAEAPFSKSNAR